MWALTLALVLAQEAPNTVRFQSTRAESAARCPDQTWLEDDVIARLGSSPFRPEAPLEAEMQFTCSASQCRGVLVLTRRAQPPRRREVTGADCREVALSLTLALALAVDPMLLVRPPRVAEPNPVPPTPPPPLPPEDAGVPAAQAFDAGVVLPEPPITLPGSPSDSVLPFVRLDARVVSGLGPTATGGLSVGGGVRQFRWSIALEARVDLPQLATSTLGDPVESQSILGTVVPCARFGGLSTCLVATVGVLRVEGRYLGGQRVSSAFVLAGARIDYEFVLNRWLGVLALGSAQVVLTRATVRAGSEVVWVTPLLAAELGLGAVVHW